MRAVLSRVLSALVGGAAVLHAVLSFGVVGPREVLWIAGIAPVACLVFRPRNGLLLAGSLLAVTLALNAVVAFSGLGDSAYYRPMEAFTVYDFGMDSLKFEENARVNTTVPFGDLSAMQADPADPRPRRIEFATDEFGFRNDASYRGQDWVLVGDSFIAGHGLTQDDTLANQLRNRHGLDAYSLAYPGDVIDYAVYVRTFRSRYDAEPRFLLFFFEGNDFGSAKDRDKGKSAAYLLAKKIRNWYRNQPLPRYVFMLSRRLSGGDASQRVALRQTSNATLAFSKDNMRVVRRDEYTGGPDFEAAFAELAPHAAHVFFIPAKPRVYAETAWPDGAPDLPNAQWEYLHRLADHHGVPTTDLTPALRRRARELKPGGKYVFLVDDCHWSPEGVRAAAEVVAGALGKRSDPIKSP
jgi:hypothetical protein